MQRALAVTYRTRGKLDFAQITHICFLGCALFHALSFLGGFISANLHFLRLFVVAMLRLDAFDKLGDERFDILAGKVQEA